MQRKTKRIIGAAALICALAAGGAAFTASNTVPDSVAGYGSDTVSGATATTIHYVLSSDGQEITGVNLVFSQDLTNNNAGPDYTVKAGFDGTGAPTACTVGTYTSGTGTSVACTGFTESTASSASLNVAVAQ